MSTSLSLSPQEASQKFIDCIWAYYLQHKRSFVWRNHPNPYAILVSEIMLQQTPTDRVCHKFELFLEIFPTFSDLAHAPLKDLLSVWQGLGYNRRALALQKIAHIVVSEYEGILPQNPELLVTFPGIGKATAASICAFAFNMPTIFIETNIRTVFIHFFFANQNNIQDAELYPLVQSTLDLTNPREWYYALMDYGVMLKKNIPNPSRRSAHHTQQTKFEGSDRQIRGMILKILTAQQHATHEELCTLIPREIHRIDKALSELIREKFIISLHNYFKIK